MKVMHPDGNTMVFMQEGTNYLADLEINGPGWVSIGYIAGDRHILVDTEEWPYFVRMVLEIDGERSRLIK